ncbi:unnamed protein product, partial [marine sediment metagenome]
MLKDAKNREEERLRKKKERYKGKDVRDLSAPCPDSVRGMSGGEARVQRTENINNPPISPLGDRIMESWNSHMPSKIRSLGKGRVDAIKRNLKLDSLWSAKYFKAAPMFPSVDDTSWPGGKFTFDFTLRMRTKEGEFSPVVDRVLNG